MGVELSRSPERKLAQEVTGKGRGIHETARFADTSEKVDEALRKHANSKE